MARRARCRNHGLGASKRFGDVLAVDRIDLQVGEGEFFSLLGPSGSLAFALSLDEIVVTNFTAGAQSTPPIWIFNNLLRP